MDAHDWLAERFEAHRTHLRAVAYRILGSPADADDAVQEAWLRLARSDSSEVENLGGWLVTRLDPDVVLRADQTVVRIGTEAETRGAQQVAGFFSGRARAARLALIDGVAGLVWASGGRPRVVFSFTLSGGKITAIDLL